MSINLENSSVITGLEKVSFHSNPKEGQCSKIFKLSSIMLISQATMFLLKNLQDSLQQYMSWELPEVQAGSQRGRGTRCQIANTHRIMEKAREFLKNICLIEYAKDFEFVHHNKLWKVLKELGVLEHFTCHLRNLYVSKRAILRSLHATIDWFKIYKEEWEGYTFSSCLYILYVEYIMWNAQLDESQAGIKIAWRNINSFR